MGHLPCIPDVRQYRLLKTRKPWFPHRAMSTDQGALDGCIPVAIPTIDGSRRGNENLGGLYVSVCTGEV